MSEKKQVMVRLDPPDYETLRLHAYKAGVPVAVLARVLIKQRLDNLETERSLLEGVAPEISAGETTTVEVSTLPPASPSGRSSSSTRRRKKKKNRR